MAKKKLYPLAGALALLLIAFAVYPVGNRPVQAQTPPTCARWDEPVLIFDGDTWTQFTDLAVAPDGTVYGVWTNNVFGDPNAGEGQVSTKDFAVFLAAMPGTGRQVQPNDILAQATYPRILFDEAGHMHLFRSQQCLAHSAALDSEASSGLTWLETTSACIDRTRSTFGVAASIDGTLHLAWSDDNAQAVRHASSQNGGQQWSDPVIVAQARSTGEFITDVELAVGNDNSLHVVWAYRCAEGNTCFAIGYSSSEDQGSIWSEPIILSESKSVQPVIALHDSQVHVVWNGTVDVSKRFHRYSNDNGVSWSSTAIISDGPIGGILGAPGLAIDSNGNVHAVAATGSAILYTCWDGEMWSPPLPLRQSVGDVGYPSLIVAEGNRLHAMWHEGVRRIWYASAQLDVPQVETLFPANRLDQSDIPRLASVVPDPTRTTGLQPTTELQGMRTPFPDSTEPRAAPSQSSALLIGILSAVLIVGFVLVFVAGSKRHR